MNSASDLPRARSRTGSRYPLAPGSGASLFFTMSRRPSAHSQFQRSRVGAEVLDGRFDGAAAVGAQQAVVYARAGAVKWLRPVMMFDDALQSAAGTDSSRHADFLDKIRSYTDRLRRLFWPGALQDAIPPNEACVGCGAHELY